MNQALAFFRKGASRVAGSAGLCFLFPFLFLAPRSLTAEGAVFLRGDANGDTSVSISDAYHTLNFLYKRGPAPECFDAADVTRATLHARRPVSHVPCLLARPPSPAAVPTRAAG